MNTPWSMWTADGSLPGPPSCRTVCRDHRTPDTSYWTTGRSRYRTGWTWSSPSAPTGTAPPAARFRFQVTLDPALTAAGQIRPVEQWVELDGQQIYVDRLEIYPTHARLLLEDHPDNTARLTSLLCHLEDETGRRYEREGGLSGFSDPDTGSLTQLRLASPYFQQPEQLTLRITGAAWQEPDKAEVTVDLASGHCRRTPGGDPADPGG